MPGVLFGRRFIDPLSLLTHSLCAQMAERTNLQNERVKRAKEANTKVQRHPPPPSFFSLHLLLTSALCPSAEAPQRLLHRRRDRLLVDRTGCRRAAGGGGLVYWRVLLDGVLVECIGA